MKSIFRYPGGKTRAEIQKWIISHIPDGMREYREPFVGGGGIFFGLHSPQTGPSLCDALPRFEKCWINDKHSGLVEVYKALRDRPAEFIAACKAIEPERDDDPQTETGVRGGKPTNARLKAVFDGLKLNEECDQALRYFFVNRTVHGSGRVNYAIPSRLYFSNPSGWDVVKNGSLDKAASVLRGVKITCGHYAKLFSAPGDAVFIYADPPYAVNTDLTPSSQLYQHSFTREDHVKFAEVVRNCEHKVCISYDDDGEGFIRSLFSDFHIIEGSWKYAGTTEKKKRQGQELLILNYDPPTTVVSLPPAQVDEPLADDEFRILEECEGTLEAAIRQGRELYVTIGLTLARIRDSGKPSKRIYRTTHATFEDYCHERWCLSKRRANQYIEAAIRFERLKTGKKFPILPERESHVAALARCDSDDQAAEVWQAVLESVADPKEITAGKIRAAVNEAIGYEPPEIDLFEKARKLLLQLSDDDRSRLFQEFLSQMEAA